MKSRLLSKRNPDHSRVHIQVQHSSGDTRSCTPGRAHSCIPGRAHSSHSRHRHRHRQRVQPQQRGQPQLPSCGSSKSCAGCSNSCHSCHSSRSSACTSYCNSVACRRALPFELTTTFPFTLFLVNMSVRNEGADEDEDEDGREAHFENWYFPPVLGAEVISPC